MAAYATLSDVKAWLGITGDTDDALLTRLINAESARIDSYVDRVLSATNYDIVFSGNGRSSIVFPQYPIISVSSVSVNGVSIPAYVAPNGYGYAFSAWRIQLEGRAFSWGVNNCRAVFRAGYETIPLDVVQACIELVALRYRERDRIGHVSKTLAGETIAFTTTEMTDSVKQKLNQYRRTMTAGWGSF